MDLKEIQAPVSQLLSATDTILKKTVTSNIKLIKRIANLTPITKGKKIRSTLLFLLAGLNHAPKQDLSSIAASIEMFHISSLIHDDIIDNSMLRRGAKTLNVNLGNYISVLGGDFLFINSLHFLNSIKKRLLLDIILDAASAMIEGQILEVENNFNYNMPARTYFDVVEKKTSALFAGVTEIASVLSGGDVDARQRYRQFGLNFGTMFQISDDMLDIFSNNSGKDRFRDLKEGKVTLPYILLLKKNRKEGLALLKSGDHTELLRRFREYQIKEHSLERLDIYYRDCVNFIDPFPASPCKEALLKLLDFTKYRDY